jgi:hypothetical protein
MEPNLVKKQFFPINSFIETSYQYQNVNIDKNLRNLVTDFFYKKNLKWKNLYNYKKKFQYNDIYIILKKFINNANINWYDLKDNYYIVKKYLLKKLSSINN